LSCNTDGACERLDQIAATIPVTPELVYARAILLQRPTLVATRLGRQTSHMRLVIWLAVPVGVLVAAAGLTVILSWSSGSGFCATWLAMLEAGCK
jgi:hypothetical protein